MQAGESISTTEVSAAALDGTEVTIQRLRLPQRAPGEIDIAISVAAICGSDLHTILGNRPAPRPTVLGHEGVGRVVDLDADATDLRGAVLRRGDRVVFSMMSSCGACDRCLDTLPMKCRTLVKYGHESAATPPHATGTLATMVRLLPGVSVLRIPATAADAQVVSAGCAVATAAAIVAAAGPRVKDGRALVFGAGAVGAYTAAMLASLGCTVAVRDPSADRLALVRSLGTGVPDPVDSLYPVVVEASGSAQAFGEAIHRADVGARVVAAGSVSPGTTTAAFDPALLVTRCLQVVGVHNYTPDDFRRGVDWLVTHGNQLRLERLASPPFPLAAIDDAIHAMRAGRYPRVLVRPREESG